MGANHNVVTRRRGDAEVPFARMTELPLRSATYEDLLKVPDHLVAEVINGELYVSPHPASRHVRARIVLGAKLGQSFDSGERGPDGWWMIDQPELHLAANAIVP